ncbi:hypothetical protein [Treponema peruense]|uniref:hypothetical protein n=1 Tax=Treponema peruense TaxID=2787628 RepID=UPI0039EFFD77
MGVENFIGIITATKFAKAVIRPLNLQEKNRLVTQPTWIIIIFKIAGVFIIYTKYFCSYRIFYSEKKFW